MPNTGPDPLQVAVGILIEGERVLVSQRKSGVHLSEYWEFPGGKIEPDETLEAALAREFLEELDLHISAITPLMEISHSYPEKDVCLQVCRIGNYSGKPQGLEGQPVKWCTADTLRTLKFPEANQAILDFVLCQI